MDVFGILNPDPHTNLYGFETRFFLWKNRTINNFILIPGRSLLDPDKDIWPDPDPDSINMDLGSKNKIYMTNTVKQNIPGNKTIKKKITNKELKNRFLPPGSCTWELINC